MKALVLTGSKTEIAESVARVDGVISEVIVFVNEQTDPATIPSEAEMFAEMEPFTVRAGGADYSRESLYQRADGE